MDRRKQDVLERLVSVEPRDLCSEAKIEKCRATRDLRSCGRTVQHILTSCGHASLCAECSQRCDVCPICRIPITKQEGALRLRLFDECVEAGLLPFRDEVFKEREGRICTVDIQRLWAFFDVALENKLVSLICHYVTDVCMDEGAVSSDAVVSMLLDGEAVKEWCKRTFISILRGLRDHYNLGVKQKQNKIESLDRFGAKLAGLGYVLDSLEAPVYDLLSAPIVELRQLSEGVRRVSQHLDVMSWCTRHRFLENVQSCHASITYWRTVFSDRKSAAHERAWPDYLNNPGQIGSRDQPTLFIEDALTNVGYGKDNNEDNTKDCFEVACLKQGNALSSFRSRREAGVGESILHGPVALYPPENTRMFVDLLFLEENSNLFLAKKAIFLYYLFDRHWALPDSGWRSVIDDYVGTFGIARHDMIESLVFYLLDDNSELALEEACRLLPEITSPRIHPKVARVLLDRQRPDAALGVLRCSGRDGRLGLSEGADKSGVPSLLEAVTAVRVRLECGLLTEAYLYQRSHSARVKAGEQRSKTSRSSLSDDNAFGVSRDWLSEMEVLVGELCWLCIRRNLVDRMIELPWQVDEEFVVRNCLLERAALDPSSTSGNLMVVFYIQRCRYVEAYLVHKRLCNLEQQFISQTGDGEKIAQIKSACEQRTKLMDKSIELLPEIQRQQLRHGTLDGVLQGPMLGKGLDFLDKKMATEQHVAPVLTPSSRAMPTTLFTSIKSSEVKNRLARTSFSKTEDMSAPSTSGWGDFRQPSILHGRPFKSSSTGPLILSHSNSPVSNGIATKMDYGGSFMSPVLGRRLRYDGDSSVNSQAVEQPNSTPDEQRLNNVLLESRWGEQWEEHTTNDGSEGTVAVSQQQQAMDGRSGFMENIYDHENTIIKRPDLDTDVLNRGQNGAQPAFDNGLPVKASIDFSNVSLKHYDNGLHYGEDHDWGSIQGWPEATRAQICDPVKDVISNDSSAGCQLLNLGPIGKRQPSDRSWLDISSLDESTERGLGGATAPSTSLTNKLQHFSQSSTSIDFFQRKSFSEVETSGSRPKGNGGVRWRTDDDDESMDGSYLSVTTLKASSNSGRANCPRRFSKNYAL